MPSQDFVDCINSTNVTRIKPWSILYKKERQELMSICVILCSLFQIMASSTSSLRDFLCNQTFQEKQVSFFARVQQSAGGEPGGCISIEKRVKSPLKNECSEAEKCFDTNQALREQLQDLLDITCKNTHTTRVRNEMQDFLYYRNGDHILMTELVTPQITWEKNCMPAFFKLPKPKHVADHVSWWRS